MPVKEDWEEMNFINIRPEDGTLITSSTMRHVSRVIHGKCGKDPVLGMVMPDWDFHSLRHTHGTALVEAKVDYKYISERLGHRNVETTLNIYVHSTEKLRDRERGILDTIYR